MIAWRGAYPIPKAEDYTFIRAQLLDEYMASVDRVHVQDVLIECICRGGNWPTVFDTVLGQYRSLTLDEWVDRRVQWSSEKLLKRLTRECWKRIRKRIWERDGGVCHVCDRRMSFDIYQCGHIIDRVIGGCDRDSNLVAMCAPCNRYVKGFHRSHDEYQYWLGIDPAVADARAYARRHNNLFGQPVSS